MCIRDSNEIPRAPNISKSLLREKMYELWQEQWLNNETCRQTKQFYATINQKRSKKILKLARSQLTTLVKVTTGHNALAYHASNIDPTIDPSCSLCELENETFFHLATTCPRLRLLRQDIVLDDDVESPDTWTPTRILELARSVPVEGLLDRYIAE